ncbi:hypothetical protein QZH56_00975 [Streptomyces olivoreticuli]|uniref:hypothetical protein n=1 Tax=Streptomyces olivoreticuli TaxID=68246 RepID=UPI002659FB7E|nr:hypothetical protein [Streptomyces olivoreticuli]WKK24274.1 hypothetical protein QZH56_00975 [Streptomyces olivoreticuli]
MSQEESYSYETDYDVSVRYDDEDGESYYHFGDEGSGYRWKTAGAGTQHTVVMPEHCELGWDGQKVTVKCAENDFYTQVEITIVASMGGFSFGGSGLLEADGSEYAVQLTSIDGSSVYGGLDKVFSEPEWHSRIRCFPVSGDVPSGHYDRQDIKGYVSVTAASTVRESTVQVPDASSDLGTYSQQGRLGKVVPVLDPSDLVETFAEAGKQTIAYLARRNPGAFTDVAGRPIPAEQVVEKLEEAYKEALPALSKIKLRTVVIKSAGTGASNAMGVWGVYSAFSNDDVSALDKASAVTGVLSSGLDAAAAAATGVKAGTVAFKGTAKAAEKILGRVAFVFGVASDGLALASAIKNGDQEAIALDGASLVGTAISPIFPPALLLSIPAVYMSLESLFADEVPVTKEDFLAMLEVREKLTKSVIEQATSPKEDAVTRATAYMTYQKVVASKIIALQTGQERSGLAGDRAAVTALDSEEEQARKSLASDDWAEQAVREVARAHVEAVCGNHELVMEVVYDAMDKWIDGWTIPPSMAVRLDIGFRKKGYGPVPIGDANRLYRHLVKQAIRLHPEKQFRPAATDPMFTSVAESWATASRNDRDDSVALPLLEDHTGSSCIPR